MANEGKVLFIVKSGRTRAFPLRVLLDTGAQSMMIGKWLANELRLLPSDLDFYPFIIATSQGARNKRQGFLNS